MNLHKMMKQAQDMQTKLSQLQDKIALEEMDGASGNGLVKVVVNGKGEMRKLSIDKSLIDPNEREMLEDLVIVAFNDAKARMDAHASTQMNALAGAMGMPAGMKLPF